MAKYRRKVLGHSIPQYQDLPELAEAWQWKDAPRGVLLDYMHDRDTRNLGSLHHAADWVVKGEDSKWFHLSDDVFSACYKIAVPKVEFLVSMHLEGPWADPATGPDSEVIMKAWHAFMCVMGSHYVDCAATEILVKRLATNDAEDNETQSKQDSQTLSEVRAILNSDKSYRMQTIQSNLVDCLKGIVADKRRLMKLASITSTEVVALRADIADAFRRLDILRTSLADTFRPQANQPGPCA